MNTSNRLAVWSTPDTPAGYRRALLALLGIVAFILIVTTVAGAAFLPPLALSVPIVLGGLMLTLDRLRILLVAVVAAFVIEVSDLSFGTVRPGAIVVLILISLIAVRLSADRTRTGLSIGRGESMLYDLSEQLARQADLPDLPAGWDVQVELRTAGASAFGGDFLVSHRTGNILELAMVDVSGKGVDAGTRALLLSGAFGGLLGAVSSEEFFCSANRYLLGQHWDEGFATAVHLWLDLDTGAFRVTDAGHPPVAQLAGGSGKWKVLDVEGTVLGLMPDAEFGVRSGTLAPTDALLLYTDGVVEVPGRDLSVGIDRLLGAADRLVASGFEGGAGRLVDLAADARTIDDRALVLIRRT